MAAKKKRARALKGNIRPKGAVKKKPKVYSSGITSKKKTTKRQNKKHSSGISRGKGKYSSGITSKKTTKKTTAKRGKSAGVTKVRRTSGKKPRNRNAARSDSERTSAVHKKQKSPKAQSKASQKPSLPYQHPVGIDRRIDTLTSRTPRSPQLDRFLDVAILRTEEFIGAWARREELQQVLDIDDSEWEGIFEYAVEKLEERGYSRDQILALYRSECDFLIPLLDATLKEGMPEGSNYGTWRHLLDMIEQKDQRWISFLDFADFLDIDEGDARDEWFSPTVGAA
jgi:hypothetical protein